MGKSQESPKKNTPQPASPQKPPLMFTPVTPTSPKTPPRLAVGPHAAPAEANSAASRRTFQGTPYARRSLFDTRPAQAHSPQKASPLNSPRKLSARTREIPNPYAGQPITELSTIVMTDCLMFPNPALQEKALTYFQSYFIENDSFDHPQIGDLCQFAIRVKSLWEVWQKPHLGSAMAAQSEHIVVKFIAEKWQDHFIKNALSTIVSKQQHSIDMLAPHFYGGGNENHALLGDLSGLFQKIKDDWDTIVIGFAEEGPPLPENIFITFLEKKSTNQRDLFKP